MRRRLPWWVLALLFVGLPLLEIYLIVQLGQAVGPWWTILVLLAAGALGSYLVKHEGSRAWRALQEALAAHRMPAKELADGALILIGGTLLLTPGFVSDVVGLFCILPFTRPLARRALTRLVARRLVVATQPSGSGTPRSGPRTARRPGHEDVVRGEVVDGD
jgi:UPF0716 protein FxsA